MYPRLLHIYGPLWIQSYGAMIALGFIAFLYITYHHPKRLKTISGDLYLNTLFVGLVGGILGGRLLYLILEWNSFDNLFPDIFYPWVGGFVVLGSVIGVLISATLYLLSKHIPVLPMFDLATQHAPLMQAIARIGCFLAGCCYGTHTDVSWAVTFTNPDSIAPLYTQLHPVQLYFSIVYFILFGLFYFLDKHISNKIGYFTFIYLISENGIRFTLDFWRGDRGDLVMWSLSQSQLLSLLFFVLSCVGLVIVVHLHHKQKTK